jgi:hypothetical protein
LYYKCVVALHFSKYEQQQIIEDKITGEVERKMVKRKKANLLEEIYRIRN